MTRPESTPLAERMRPQTLDDVVGQSHLLGQGKPLRAAHASGQLHSMILWGPPGTGKTTLARLLAQACRANFVALSAVEAGIKEVRNAVQSARQHRQQFDESTVLFLDEVHRFNKSQQDAFLPFVEDGTLTFIGATTENPSFALNNALLSRSTTYVLKSLETADLRQLIARALSDVDRGIGGQALELDDKAAVMLAEAADGDARRALGLLEIAASLNEGKVIDVTSLEAVLAGRARRFDRGGDNFYDQISALHKSVRGSDPDASIYWLARMLDGGCDPQYVARRLVRIATEDIGNADPRALSITLDAWTAFQRMGSPEGELALYQAVLFLAVAAKSNASYSAANAALADIKQRGSLEVPLALRNAPTSLMKDLDYGKGYRYAHDEPDGFAAGATYLPDELSGQQYYHPQPRGLEIRIGERLEELRRQNKAAATPSNNQSKKHER